MVGVLVIHTAGVLIIQGMHPKHVLKAIYRACHSNKRFVVSVHSSMA